MVETENKGCKVHGPWQVCGHDDDDCPDLKFSPLIITPLVVEKTSGVSVGDRDSLENFNEDKRVMLQEEGFDEETINYLISLPENLWKKLTQKRFYHTTTSKNADSILVSGLKLDAPIIDKDGIDFFDEMCDKFGINKKDDSVNHYIKGNKFDRDDIKRGVYLSDFQADDFYPIPESLKFFLRNILYLINSQKLNFNELARAKNIYDRHVALITDDLSSSILEVDMLARPVFEAVFHQWGKVSELDEETFEMALDHSEPNLIVDSPIDAKHIKFLRKFSLGHDEVISMLDDDFWVLFKGI